MVILKVMANKSTNIKEIEEIPNDMGEDTKAYEINEDQNTLSKIYLSDKINEIIRHLNSLKKK